MSQKYATLKVTGRFVVEVDTDNIEEVKRLTSEAFCDADFGELSDIDAVLIRIQNEKDEDIWLA